MRSLVEELEHLDPASTLAAGLRAQLVEETGRLSSYELASEAPSSRSAPITAGRDRTRPRVLIVEDDPGTRTALAHWLSENYDVVTACDGAEGLEQAAAWIPDVVVTDVWMPRVDGISMVRRMKSIDSLRAVPVMFLTGQTSPEAVDAGLSTGAAEYLEKPIDLDVFELKLRAALERVRGVEGRTRR